jgi:glycosyltransferase involved in cell wall biosynthesis
VGDSRLVDDCGRAEIISDAKHLEAERMIQATKPDECPPGQPAMGHNTVVVAIPTFNEARFVLETLTSVQAQTHGDFLAVVSDNGSTDQTVEICQKFCRADNRFVVISQPLNLGAAGNFQWLFDNTASPYFMWLGGHDMISGDFLEKHLHALSCDPTLALSYANSRCIDQNSKFAGEKDGGNYHRIAGTPAQRYRRTLQRMGPAEPMNNLFRRESLKGVPFKPVTSIDRMILCQAAYWGQFNKINEPLYVRRLFTDRKDGSVARLARIKGHAVTGANRLATLFEFQRQFNLLENNMVERALFAMTIWKRHFKYIWRDIKRK